VSRDNLCNEEERYSDSLHLYSGLRLLTDSTHGYLFDRRTAVELSSLVLEALTSSIQYHILPTRKDRRQDRTFSDPDLETELDSRP
jgi:hypothetical protein